MAVHCHDKVLASHRGNKHAKLVVLLHASPKLREGILCLQAIKNKASSLQTQKKAKLHTGQSVVLLPVHQVKHLYTESLQICKSSVCVICGALEQGTGLQVCHSHVCVSCRPLRTRNWPSSLS